MKNEVRMKNEEGRMKNEVRMKNEEGRRKNEVRRKNEEGRRKNEVRRKLEQIDQINTQVNALEGVEKAWVQMPTATLRVYADINDDADSDAAREKSDAIYEIVTGVLDPAVYFTQADGKKMYDLEIHVYNHPKSENAEEDDGFVYVIKNKSSSMSDPRTQVVSVPVDSELAQQLRDETAERIAAEEAAKAEAEAAAKAEAEGGESEEAPAEEEPAEESEEE